MKNSFYMSIKMLKINLFFYQFSFKKINRIEKHFSFSFFFFDEWKKKKNFFYIHSTQTITKKEKLINETRGKSVYENFLFSFTLSEWNFFFMWVERTMFASCLLDFMNWNQQNKKTAEFSCFNRVQQKENDYFLLLFFPESGREQRPNSVRSHTHYFWDGIDWPNSSLNEHEARIICCKTRSNKR